jgi:hypothetical protein
MGESNADVDRGVETDTGNGTDPEESSGISRKMLLGGGIAGFGVVTTGILVYVLERVGPPGAQELVWILGYGLTIFALWYLFLRPIDLRGGG